MRNIAIARKTLEAGCLFLEILVKKVFNSDDAVEKVQYAESSRDRQEWINLLVGGLAAHHSTPVSMWKPARNWRSRLHDAGPFIKQLPKASKYFMINSHRS